jgi:hypothetical protein
MSKIEIGKKYQTKSNIKVKRVLCTDAAAPFSVVVLLENGKIIRTTEHGEYYEVEIPHDFDLVEVSPFSEFKDGDPVMVRDNDMQVWRKRYFARVSPQSSSIQAYTDGTTKWSNDGRFSDWNQCRKPTQAELE